MENEKEIIKRAQNGDSDAVTIILEKYKSLVRSLARPLFLVDGDKDDLIQEGMIGLFKAIQTYSDEKGTTFETFAYMCVYGKLCSAIKKSNRKKNIPLNSYVSLYETENSNIDGVCEKEFLLDRLLYDNGDNPEDIVINRENNDNSISNLIENLSKMEKQVLELFLRGLTYQEIAINLNKTPKSIDNALQRIKKKMQKISDKRE